MTLESQLREALTARADEVGGPGGFSQDPYARVAEAITVSRRRRRTMALTAVAAAAAIAVAIPSLSGGLGRDTTTPAKHTQVVVPGPSDPRWASMTTWPTRGSLAADRDFLSSFRTVVPGVSLLYAGDLGSDRVVVTWGPGDDGTDGVTVYADDRGAPAADLTTISSAGQVDAAAVVVRRDTTPQGWLLLLTTPGLRSAEVSPTVQLATDGTVTRTWQTVPLRDGTALVELHDAPLSLTRVRVGGYDEGTYLPARRGPVDPDTEGFCGNCTGQDFLDHAEKGTSAGVATTFGLSTSQVTTRTLVNATVDPAVLALSGVGDAGPGATGRLYVGLTRLPGGQVVRTVSLGVEEKAGGGMSTSLEEAVPIDAATAGQRPVILHGQTSDGSHVQYQVFAPGAARVQLVSQSPSLYPDSAVVALRGGSAVLTTPAGADPESPYRVSTFDASGGLIGTWPVDLPNRDDPYDLRP